MTDRIQKQILKQKNQFDIPVLTGAADTSADLNRAANMNTPFTMNCLLIQFLS